MGELVAAKDIASIFAGFAANAANRWIKRNWGLASFVNSFIAVVTGHRLRFEGCCKRLDTLQIQQSARSVAANPRQKSLLNVKLRMLFTSFRTFSRVMQTFIEQISDHYRLSKDDHGQVLTAIEGMNRVMNRIHDTITDSIILCGGLRDLPDIRLIPKIQFSRRGYTAKIRGKGGPAHIRTRGNAYHAESILNSSDEELHKRAEEISEQTRRVVNLQQEIVNHIDEDIHRELQLRDAQLKKDNEEALRSMEAENEVKVKAIQEEYEAKFEQFTSEIRRLEAEHKLQQQELPKIAQEEARRHTQVAEVRQAKLEKEIQLERLATEAELEEKLQRVIEEERKKAELKLEMERNETLALKLKQAHLEGKLKAEQQIVIIVSSLFMISVSMLIIWKF